MDDLPDLPFQKVLSFLSLEDRLKMRAVSKSCHQKIDNSRVKTLCYSDFPSSFIWGKSRWVSGAYAQNFIWSTRFSSFFKTFGSTILSNLKSLRICKLYFDTKDNCASFVPTLNLFGRLEELDLIKFTHPNVSGVNGEFELNLPMLASIYLDQVKGIDQLTLNASKLKRVKLFDCFLRLELVHADSVEWLANNGMAQVEVKNLKSLKYLHCGQTSEIDATLLSGLEKLKEVHLQNRINISELFEQKRRFGRADLKIYLFGWLLNGPDDPILHSDGFLEEIFDCLAKNPSRLADEIPFYGELNYDAIERVARGSEVNVVNRLNDLDAITLDNAPIEDIGRFLNFLTKYPNIVSLQILNDQPQDLFDRLPENCTIQDLNIACPVSDFGFLFRLEHLIGLRLSEGVDLELVRNVLEKCELLVTFDFKYRHRKIQIFTYHHPKQFDVSVNEKSTSDADLEAAIAFIVENTAE